MGKHAFTPVPVLVLAAIGFALPAVAGCAKKQQLVAVAPPPPPPPPPPAPAPPPPPERIVLPGELEFGVNEAVIRETADNVALLNQLAAIMQKNARITRLRIEGHTDNRGSARHNLQLSQTRADAVATWLADHAVDRGRIATIGYGSTRPVADNDTEEHRTMNRRTEFHVQELDGKPTADAPPDGPSPPAAVAKR
jgi:outer membrane protein OmpA-like peptidoglycan-associated protein